MTTKDPGPRRNKAHAVFCALVYILALAFLIAYAAACGAARPAVTLRDSVRVEIRERVVRDTAVVTLPPVVIEKVVADTVSHIESAYASSEAAIRGGCLHHSLTSSGKTVRVPVTVTVHDTLIVERNAETIYVDVPRQPTKWESFLEVCGWMLLGAVALAVLCLILRTVLRR
ncbi:MAG: hypothetical protein IJU13_04215 [Bacteroidales bacterium]|nr:hypothetical protein [Bacteroidales bacterium]